MEMNEKEFGRTVGRRIKARRLSLDKTLKDVFEETGIAIATLSNIESGKQSPNKGTLEKISSALGMDMDVLTGASETAEEAEMRRRREDILRHARESFGYCLGVLTQALMYHGAVMGYKIADNLPLLVTENFTKIDTPLVDALRRETERMADKPEAESSLMELADAYYRMRDERGKAGKPTQMMTTDEAGQFHIGYYNERKWHVVGMSL